jgi:hypothetical protein
VRELRQFSGDENQDWFGVTPGRGRQGHAK